MTIAYRADSGVEVAGTSIVVPKPTGTVTDDVMFAAILTYQDRTITPPSGWTHVLTTTVGTDLRQSIFRRTIAGSEPSTYTWSISGASTNLVGAIIAFQYVDTVTPVDVSGGQSSTTTATPAIGGGSQDIVCFFGGQASSEGFSWVPDAGLTKQTDNGHATFPYVSMAIATGTGSSGASRTATPTKTLSSGIGQALTVLPAKPYAPTILQPLEGTQFLPAATQRFQWVFSHVDPSETQTSWLLQYAPLNSASWTTVSPGTGTNQYWDSPASTFTTGMWKWKVRTYDGTRFSDDSAEGTFAVGNPPNAPTLTFPVAGTAINRAEPQTFTWTYSDPDGGAQGGYELRYRPGGVTPWTDTLTATTANQFRNIAAEFFTAGDWEWQVRTIDPTGLIGPWSTTASFQAGSQIKYWNGSAWQPTTLRHWDGVAFQPTTLRRWNGTAWVTV